jgi:hypothetical protein
MAIYVIPILFSDKKNILYSFSKKPIYFHIQFTFMNWNDQDDHRSCGFYLLMDIGWGFRPLNEQLKKTTYNMEKNL